jgi:hypothetical protein
VKPVKGTEFALSTPGFMTVKVLEDSLHVDIVGVDGKILHQVAIGHPASK